MLGRRFRFEFDWANLTHIADHGVEQREILQAFRRRNVIMSSTKVDGEKRWEVYGKTIEDRYLVVVFTRRKGKVQPVTATMKKEREQYGRRIGEEAKLQQ